jgi:hypothetical protein
VLPVFRKALFKIDGVHDMAVARFTPSPSLLFRGQPTLGYA